MINEESWLLIIFRYKRTAHYTIVCVCNKQQQLCNESLKSRVNGKYNRMWLFLTYTGLKTAKTTIFNAWARHSVTFVNKGVFRFWHRQHISPVTGDGERREDKLDTQDDLMSEWRLSLSMLTVLGRQCGHSGNGSRLNINRAPPSLNVNHQTGRNAGWSGTLKRL